MRIQNTFGGGSISMQKDIGKFMQETRKSVGLTQKEIADRIGVSDKTISKWENGVSHS